MLQSRLGHKEIPEEIRAERLFELRPIDVLDVSLLVLLGRIVDENIGTASRCD
jgi:hypothetical protein